MTKRLAPEKDRFSESPWDKIRSRIAITMVGLMGGAAVPTTLQACKASLSPNTIDSCRNATVEEGKMKTIVVSEAGAVVYLSRARTGKEKKVEGVILLSSSSPLLVPSDQIQEYTIPEKGYPWTRLIAEPSGRITMKMETNELALLFVCKYPNEPAITSCMGHETDPETMDQALAEAQKKIDDKWKKELLDATAKGDAGTDVATDANAETNGSVNEVGDAGATVHEVSDSTFQSEVLNVKGKPVLVMLSAPWCKECRRQRPINSQLAEELAGKAVIAEVDIDKNTDVHQKYGTDITPTLIVFRNGEVKETMTGFHDKDVLIQLLKKHTPR